MANHGEHVDQDIGYPVAVGHPDDYVLFVKVNDKLVRGLDPINLKVS